MVLQLDLQVKALPVLHALLGRINPLLARHHVLSALQAHTDLRPELQVHQPVLL